MSDDNDDDLAVYFYRRNKGEKVPKTAEKLIVEEGVQVVNEELCYSFEDLRKVTLPTGLVDIGNRAFGACVNLLDIEIANTVEYIGAESFESCRLLTKVEFEYSPSSPHQLRFIGQAAFEYCTSLMRIKLPSAVTTLGKNAFASCEALMEVNLSTCGVTKLPAGAFSYCGSLQTVSLPKTLKRISSHACYNCSELVTVVIPLDSHPIEIGARSFENCVSLGNLVLPKNSTAHRYSFFDCKLLVERYGEDSPRIVAGLVGRFKDLLIHRMCYDHSSSLTVQELRQCVAGKQEKSSLVDEFGMTPFHVLCSTSEPSIELLEVLLDSLPNHILKCKDDNGRRPLEYLINYWTDGTSNLIQRELQKCMIDPLARWGATSWKETMESMLQELLLEDGKRRRKALCHEAYSALEHYENVESTSILEMALWKWRLTKSRWENDSSKRPASDREECRFLSGSDVAIPHVIMFLNTPQDSSEGDSSEYGNASEEEGSLESD